MLTGNPQSDNGETGQAAGNILSDTFMFSTDNTQARLVLVHGGYVDGEPDHGEKVVIFVSYTSPKGRLIGFGGSSHSKKIGTSFSLDRMSKVSSRT